jgi:NADPH-dependent ferric siderophore reductase
MFRRTGGVRSQPRSLTRAPRDYLRNERGIPRECMSALGYWKRG